MCCGPGTPHGTKQRALNESIPITNSWQISKPSTQHMTLRADRQGTLLLRDTCRLQQQARQERVQARTSNISLGDSRLHSHDTSYRVNFAAPLPGTDTLRSPLQACYCFAARLWHIC